jgi:hypothetical protein
VSTLRFSDGAISAAWERVAGVPISDALLEWPPDLFALTDVVLHRSEAYRFALSREASRPDHLTELSDAVVAAGKEWSTTVVGHERGIPDLLANEWRVFCERLSAPFEDLVHGRDQRMLEALLTLHAIADEACAGFGSVLDPTDGRGSRYRGRAQELLATTGSLARIPPDRLRVLPKARTHAGGSSVGSLSRYVCALMTTVDVRWHKLPTRRRGNPRVDHVNFLLLPWPLKVRESDFSVVQNSLDTRTVDPFGLFEFSPSESLDLDLLDRVLVSARDEVENVDVVLMPESAVDEADLDGLEALLDQHGVTGLHVGVRSRANHDGRLGSNWVHTGVSPKLERGGLPGRPTDRRWFHVRHNKHNRWLLDERQIYQYHLGGALHPHVRWWEAMEIPRRSVSFIQFGQITFCIMICEDLAQSDTLPEVLRRVGPTLIYAPLLDGPQITSRWAARYASVFADDPGSAVLTLTSFGMVQRSRPVGRDFAPVVALWKDPARGTREIRLEEGSAGILLTACTGRATQRTRDGRLPLENGTHFFDVGTQQLRAATAGSGLPLQRVESPATQVLDVDELTILTSWAEALAEAVVAAPDSLDAVLADASAGAPWRFELGIPEPSPRLAEAIAAMGNAVLRAATADGVPSVGGLVAEVEDDVARSDGVAALSRRVLQSRIASRLTQGRTPVN